MKKDLPQFEEIIKKAFKDSHNTEFKKALHLSLLEKAPNYLQQEVTSSNWRHYFLNFISMHKYSSITAFTLLIIMGVVLTFTPFQENTVNAEILEKISNTYEEESKKNGIFYQKWLVESTGLNKNDKKIQEMWYDNNKNHLHIERKFDTNEIAYIDMTKEGELFTSTFSEEEYAKQNPFLFGPQYYCVNIFYKNNKPYETLLQISKETEPFIHVSASEELYETLSSEDNSQTSQDEFLNDLVTLLNTQSKAETIQKILKKIKYNIEFNNKDFSSNKLKLEFKEIKENNKKYYLLTVVASSLQGSINLYFNTENYRLEKQKYQVISETETKTLLEHNYQENAQTQDVFNPQKYHLTKIRALMGLPAEAKKLIQEKNNGIIVDGCYDSETGMHLTPEAEKNILKKVDIKALNAYESLKKDLKEKLPTSN